ncbi:MAG: hypothetical protein JST43_00390 [Bacteroidetes bacterium]|nr:hypothetical protein [Bacteroidota bacterium]MBS1540793.1 hypothetical protein [Bacteroidota bacterium]
MELISFLNRGGWREARHRATCLPTGRSVASPRASPFARAGCGLSTSIPAAETSNALKTI